MGKKHIGSSFESFLKKEGIFEEITAKAIARKQLITDALAVEKSTLRSGKGYLAKDVHGYLKAKASGRKVSRPKTKAWR